MSENNAGFKPKKSVALSGVAAGNTALCTVGRSGNDLHYRGYDILDLAKACEFEEVAHLLVHGKLPTQAELAAYKVKLRALRGLPAAVKAALEATPANAHPMDVMRTGVSVLGTVLPIKEIAALAHAKGALLLVDGCQGVTHMPVDVQDLGVDFYAFSGHKLFGPTGISVLYGRRDLLEAMPPYQTGGEMIEVVTFEKTTYADLPFKYEAGTPNIAGAIGLGAAVDYVAGLGLDRIAAHEHDLLAYATERLGALNSVRLIGTAPEKAAIVSFNLEGIHPHDVGTILDREGVAVRTGHHCAQPVMDHYGVAATARISFGCYNTREEVDVAVAALRRARDVFA